MSRHSFDSLPSLPRRSALAGALALALATAGTAQDHRENGTPTGALVYSGVDSTFLSNVINQGYRLTDLEIQTLSPRRYAATLVRNAGVYASGWWWLTQATPSQLSDFLAQNQARIIDLEPFVVSGQLYFAAVMVPNTGANQKAWWWYYNATPQNLVTLANQNNARLVDVEDYSLNGNTYRAGVMIRNTGDDQRHWSYLAGVSAATVGNHASSTGRRIYDLERVSGGFDAIFTQQTGAKWWWYYGLTLQQVVDTANQIGARVVDVESHQTVQGTRFDILLTNNSNALTTRLSSLLRSTTDGVSGVYLKRVNGSVLAALNSEREMDPASVLKTLHLVRAMRMVSLGQLSLNQNIAVWDGCGPTCCPTRTNADTETLQLTLQKMMRNSDNQSTLSITDLVGGLAALNTTANAVGATSTTMNHHIGCGLPANETTLVDLARMHEAVRNGYVGAFDDEFYAIMSRWNGGGQLDTIITEEAANVGLTVSQRTAFRARIEWRSKGGSYGISGKNHRGTAAWVTLPFYVNGGIVDREYVSGVFVNFSDDPNVGTPMSVVHAEAYREQIRAAMQTWKNHVFGSLITFGKGCPGSAGTPLHTAAGTPEIGQVVEYRLTGAPSRGTAFLNLGLSRTFWGRTPLPLDLAFLGAPRCEVLVAPLDSNSARIDSDGSAEVRLRLPLSSALIDAEYYTQFMVLDARANALGLTTSNGVTTSIGGQQ